MPHDDLLALLSRARKVLDHYRLDDHEMTRDDVTQICIAIDDALPDASRIAIRAAAQLDRVVDEAAG